LIYRNPSNDDENKIKNLLRNYNYLSSHKENTFIKDNHIVELRNCSAQDPLQYFKKFRTLRIFYDGRIGIQGDHDNFIRPISPIYPKDTFKELLNDINTSIDDTVNINTVFHQNLVTLP
jgi:hypothetical protein